MDNKNPGTVTTQYKNEIEWKYCKIGMTEKDTTPGPNNTMETAEREITKATKKQARTIFVLPVAATDIRPNSEIEKGVRSRIGWTVDKDLARDNMFPTPEEWVLTTQSHIYEIRRKIDEKQKRKEEVDTGLFGNIVHRDQSSW